MLGLLIAVSGLLCGWFYFQSFFFFCNESVFIYFPISLQQLLPDIFKLLLFHSHSSCKHISSLQVNMFWKGEVGRNKGNTAFRFGLKKIRKNWEHERAGFAVKLWCLSEESTGCFRFQTLVEAWEKSRWRWVYVDHPKAQEGKSNRFHVISWQSVNKAVHITVPKVSLCMYKQEFGRVWAMFGIPCWFKLTCQVTCYEAVPGYMGWRGMNENSGHEAIWKNVVGVCTELHIPQAWQCTEQW